MHMYILHAYVYTSCICIYFMYMYILHAYVYTSCICIYFMHMYILIYSCIYIVTIDYHHFTSGDFSSAATRTVRVHRGVDR